MFSILRHGEERSGSAGVSNHAPSQQSLLRVQRPDAVPVLGRRLRAEAGDAVEKDLAWRVVGHDRQAVAKAPCRALPVALAVVRERSVEGVAQFEAIDGHLALASE